MWRCILNRLPMKDQLLRRGMSLNQLNDNICVSCLENEESLPHLMFCCPVTVEVWSHVVN